MSKSVKEIPVCYGGCSSKDPEIRAMYEEALDFFRAIAERVPLDESKTSVTEDTRRRAS